MPQSSYTTDDGSVHAIRISKNTLNAQPTAPTAHTTYEPPSVRVSGTDRRIGIRARFVYIGRVVGTAPNTITRYTRLPILLLADWTALNKGSTITVGGASYTVSKKVAESIV